MNQDKTLEQQIEAIINKHIDWSNSDNITDCKIELANLIRENLENREEQLLEMNRRKNEESKTCETCSALNSKCAIHE